MEKEVRFGVLQQFFVPVVLGERVLNKRGIAELEACAQHEECRHEQCVRPSLAGKVVVCGDGVLEDALAEAERLLFQVFGLSDDEIEIFPLSGRFVQVEEAVSHRHGVHHEGRQPQIEVFVHPGGEAFHVLDSVRGTPGSADAVERHASGPVPAEIHAESPPDEEVYCPFEFGWVDCIQGIAHKRMLLGFRGRSGFTRFSSFQACRGDALHEETLEGDEQGYDGYKAQKRHREYRPPVGEARRIGE